MHDTEEELGAVEQAALLAGQVERRVFHRQLLVDILLPNENTIYYNNLE